MSNKQISIGKWLNNDKFVAVLSVLLALVIWLVVALQMSNQMQATFNEIPVTFETTMTDNLELKMLILYVPLQRNTFRVTGMR